MKINVCKSVVALIVLLLIFEIEATRSEKTNMRLSKTGILTSLEELSKMRQISGEFDPMKVTKYFKDQKPSRDSSQLFTDFLFPPNSNSIEGKDSNGNYLDQKSASIADKLMGRSSSRTNPGAPEWKRAKEIFNYKPYYVFKDNIEPADVKQQDLGNCYFVSAVASVAEFPRLIYQLFRTTSVNLNGYYELVLFIDGEWQVIILDDYFAVKSGSSATRFAAPNGEELWVMLLEKAWAKINGGYANIVGGEEKDSFYALTGFVSDFFDHKKISLDELWVSISSAEINNEIMSASTPNGKSPDEKLPNGLILGHAYTLLGTVTIIKNGKQVRLVNLRNPWGEKEWNGDWSDYSSLWTPELKKNAKFLEAKNDGIFFMTLEDFFTNFFESTICRVKYGSTVKNYKILGEEMFSPVVFNLVLLEDSNITIDTFVRHWRFNRGNGNNPDKVTSMLLGSYDDSNNVSYLTSNCRDQESVDISINLKKGSYVLWLYNSYFSLAEPKPTNYIVRLISSSRNINFRKTGLDTSAHVAKLLVNSSLGDNTTAKKTSSGIAIKTANSLYDSCIGYVRYSNENPKKSNIAINFNTDSLINMSFLAPYNVNAPSKVSFYLPPNKNFLLLAVVKNYKDPYLFTTGATFNVLKNPESNVEFLEGINISSNTSLYLLPYSKLPEFTPDYRTLSLNSNNPFNLKNLR
jgi:hypothetical protein